MEISSLVKDISTKVIASLFEGGFGSGNWGHKGRPGRRGGSLGGGGRGISAHQVRGGAKSAIDKTVVGNMVANLEKRAADSGLTKERAHDFLKSFWKGRSEAEYTAAIGAAKIPTDAEVSAKRGKEFEKARRLAKRREKEMGPTWRAVGAAIEFRAKIKKARQKAGIFGR